MEEVDKDKEIAAKCLAQMKDYIKDDELNYPLHDDNFLLIFVRAKKYDPELAYKTLKNYFALRCNNPQLGNMCFPNHEIVARIIPIKTLLKHRDPLGRPVLVVNIRDWELSKFNLDHIIASVVLKLEETLLISLEAQRTGLVHLLDFGAINLRHIAQWTPTRIKYLFSMFQGCFPVRFKAFHIVNQPKLFDLVLMAGKPFMTEKLKQRIIFHGKNLEQLHESIPPEILPEEYGGILKADEAFDKDFPINLFARDQYYREKLIYGYQKKE